jgi:UDP-glucose 4-epimerase
VRVLITGAAGFIGSHLWDRLFVEGHQVRGFDNFETGAVDYSPSVFTVDIADRQSFYEFANEVQPELVIHCAASYSDPNRWHRDVDTNVAGTINAINVAKHHNAKLVYFQTALPAISSYAISKIAGEQYIKLSGVPSLIFRLANIYGPRNLSGPIPAFFKRLSAGEPCTVVDTRRDLVYIDDLVELVMTAIGQDAIGKYDVCSGNECSILAMHNLVALALDGDTDRVMYESEVQAASEDDVPSMSLDPGPTQERFGWQANQMLPSGIAKTVVWYREHGVGETFTHLALKG